MNINGVNGLNGVSNISQTSAITRNNGTSVPSQQVQADRSEISALNAAAPKGEMNSNGVRIELVNRIREQIAAGTYYTQEKMDVAMQKLFAAEFPNE